MTVTIKRLLLCCLAWLLLTNTGYAQTHRSTDKPQHLLWATGGVGVIAPGFGGLVRLAYSWDAISSISAKIEAASSIDFFHVPNEITERSIYYGRQFTQEFILLRVAAGPGYFVRDSLATSLHRIGVGFEAEAMLKFKILGISIMFTYMLADHISIPGFTVNFSIGKLD